MKKGKLILCSAALFFVFSFILQGCSNGNGENNPGRLSFSGASFHNFIEDKDPLTSLRGFAVSPDGNSLYCGYIKGEFRGVYKTDASTGKKIWHYQDTGTIQPGFCKGIAADDRGYVYVGITLWDSEGEVRFAVIDAATGKEISLTSVLINGKIGINGIAVKKINDKYLLYFITNYGKSRIYCYDVTDPKAPVLFPSFGTNGFVDLPALMHTENFDANYLTLTDNGDIFLTANSGTGNKGDCVLKISSDGKKLLKKEEIREAYGIFYHKPYLFISTYLDMDSSVIILDDKKLKPSASVGKSPDSTPYTGVVFANNKIYITDQGYKGGSRILVSEKIKER